MNIKTNLKPFTNFNAVEAMIICLDRAVKETDTCCILYCFMPDHLHMAINGLKEHSDLWKTACKFKQYSGFWFKNNLPEIKWQKDFYDHIVRKSEDCVGQLRYIMNNPIRKGLVEDNEKYPFIGSIGCDLNEFLNESL